MPTAWQYVGGFGALAWVVFTVFARFAAGRFQPIIVGMVAVFGIALGMLAGGYARQTWIQDVARTITSIHPVLTFVIFIGLIVFIVGMSVAAIAPDHINPAVAASFGIAAAWVVVPSLLATGTLHGTWGAAITNASNWVTTTLMQMTAGAWG